MNTERILALADIIEKQPHTSPLDREGFNMADWVHACGTPCCIGGFCDVMVREDASLPKFEYVSMREAANFLGMADEYGGYGDFVELTHPNPSISGPWERISPAHAAAVLRHLAATGEVDWSVGASKEASL